MSELNYNILIKAEEFVSGFLEKNLTDKIIFHTLQHTRYVVEKAELIGRKSSLTEEEMIIVKLCAWFHDIGYAVDPENHEKIGADMAEDFLKKQDVDPEKIDKVKKCIMATHLPQQPVDNVSRVICDADLCHLAEEDYFERIDKMRREWSKLSGGKFSKRKFYAMSMKFFRMHEYQTEYAKRELQPKKDKNFELLQKEKYMLEQKKEKELLAEGGKKKKKKKDKGYSRGVESMFRLTARNQINLSSIADNKSNILISVNAIMLSITMSVMVTRFEDIPNIILPTLVFMVFSLLTIIFAILSTRPKITSGTFNKQDIRDNKVNLLFFGNFYNMKLDEYEWAVEELMKNDQNLYSTMIKDQFALGKVLARKYKLLRIAYNLFMVGIVISVIAFVLAFVNL